jgi:hypothetical protein
MLLLDAFFRCPGDCAELLEQVTPVFASGSVRYFEIRSS